MSQQARTHLSLRRILASVLVVPLGAAAACESSSGPVASGDGGVVDGAVKTEASAPSDPCAAIEIDGAAYDDDSGSDAGSACSIYLKLPCGLPEASTTRLCTPDLVTCQALCPTDILYRCTLVGGVSCYDDGGFVPDAETLVECIQCPGAAGRRPHGLAAARPFPSRSALGAYFAELAHLEAASVVAFEDLARSLASFGAPRRLRAAATRAAADERRHAGVTRRLARRFGATAPVPGVSRTRAPTLDELLAHNALEGCVGESYGALVAMWQAARAEDPAIAQAMRGIAKDEAEHAELSWELLRWGAPRVSAAARRELRARIAAAASAVVAQAGAGVADEVRSRAGHPPPEVARELAARFASFVAEEADRALGLAA